MAPKSRKRARCRIVVVSWNGWLTRKRVKKTEAIGRGASIRFSDSLQDRLLPRWRAGEGSFDGVDRSNLWAAEDGAWRVRLGADLFTVRPRVVVKGNRAPLPPTQRAPRPTFDTDSRDVARWMAADRGRAGALAEGLVVIGATGKQWRGRAAELYICFVNLSRSPLARSRAAGAGRRGLGCVLKSPRRSQFLPFRCSSPCRSGSFRIRRGSVFSSLPAPPSSSDIRGGRSR